MSADTQRQTGDGLFAWYDLMTTDERITNPFYGDLFGWEFSADARPDDGYRMVNFENQGFSGVMPWKSAMNKSYWMGYVQVTGLEERVSRARDLGANVIIELIEIPGVGRFAVLDDPTGAPFYLYETVPELRVKHSGYDRGNGHIIWNELITTDIVSAAAFYREIAGWTLAPMSDDPTPYTVAKVEGKPVAGLFQPNQPPAGSAWIISVSTSNIDATLAKAVKLGGGVVHAPNTVPGIGRTAWAADPTGGVFGLMQPEAGWLDRL